MLCFIFNKENEYVIVRSFGKIFSSVNIKHWASYENYELSNTVMEFSMFPQGVTS